MRRCAGQDRREVLLALTSKGEKVLRELSLHHKAELRMQGPALVAALKRTMQVNKNSEDADTKAASRSRRRTG